jgi:hypothetical protein
MKDPLQKRARVAPVAGEMLYSSGSVGARTPYLASPLRNSVPARLERPGNTIRRA